MFIGITDWSGAFFFFLIKTKQQPKKKRKKIKTQEKYQIGTILSICRKSDPESWQHPRAAAKGTGTTRQLPCGRGWCGGTKGGMAKEGHI